MNLPNAFRTSGSSLVRRNLNLFLDSISQIFSYFVDILENIISRSWSYILQLSKKWCSSSMALQHGHSRSVTGVLGLVHLPRSISNGCDIVEVWLGVIKFIIVKFRDDAHQNTHFLVGSQFLCISFVFSVVFTTFHKLYAFLFKRGYTLV